MVKICCIVRGNGFREVALAATKRERDWLSNYCHPTLSNLKKLIHLTLPKNVLMKQKQFFLVFPSHCYLFCRGECNGLSWTYFPSFQALVFLSSSLKLANLQLAICIWTCNYSFHHGSPTSIMYANDYRSSCRYTWTEVFQIHPCTRGRGWPCRRAARVWCCKEGWSAFRPPIEPTSRELKVKQNNIDQLSLSCKLLSVC